MGKRTPVFIAVAVLIVLICGTCFLGLWFLSVDEGAPVDGDLRADSGRISDSPNAFFWLQEAAKQADVPWDKKRKRPVAGETKAQPGGANSAEAVNSEVEKAQERIGRILGGEQWDGLFVDEVLRSNKAALASCDRAIAAVDMLVPCDLTMADGRWMTETTGDLLALKALDLAHRGNPSGAFETALQVLELGHRWEGGGGTIWGYEHGRDLKSQGLWLLGRLLKDQRPSAAQLVDAARRLGKCRANEEGLRESVRVQYACSTEVLDSILAGKTTLADIGPVSFTRAGGWKRDWPARRLSSGLTFKPSQTRRWMAEWHRQIMNQVSTSYADYREPTMPAPQRGLVDVVIRGNTAGCMICQTVLSPTKNTVHDKCAENVAVAASCLSLAIRAYKIDTGHLPAALSQLVPHYLDTVPVDDFDGKPMRYNAEKKIVYSVGDDLKDDGGMTPTEVDHWWKERHPGRTEKDYEPSVFELPDASWSVDF